MENLTKEVGTKLLFSHSLGLRLCSNSVPEKLSSQYHNCLSLHQTNRNKFSFSLNSPQIQNLPSSFQASIPFPEASFYGIPVNSKRINGRFRVRYKRLQRKDRHHLPLHGSANPWPSYLLQYLPGYSTFTLKRRHLILLLLFCNFFFIV